RFQFCDGNLRIHLRNGRTCSGSTTSGIRNGPQDKPKRTLRRLKIRLIDDGKSYRIPPVLPGITDNADNNHPKLSRIRRAKFESSPQWITYEPEAIGHRPADDGDACGGRVVGFGEESSGNQWDFENSEIIPADDLQIRSGRLAHLKSQ